MTKRHFCFLFLFILIFSFKTYGWWSAVILRESTHHKLTSKAIEQIDCAEYPDIDKFKGKICNWTSGPGDDENAHGKKYDSTAGKYNGGPYERWWLNPPNSEFKNDGVLVQYKLRNFVNGDYSAYYYLAMMAHLIADQAVPAHAANILHGFPSVILNPDNLEKQSYNEDPKYGTTVIKSDQSLDRYYYYENKSTEEKDGSIILTQNKLSGWKSSDGRNCWFENDSAKYIGEAFDSSWGKYGGDGDKDIYDEEKDNQDIVQTQFLQSVAYTAGFLRTVSEKLPPLVSGLALTSNTILQNSSTTIKFQADENRQPNIRISLSVDNKPIKATDIVWDSAEKMLQPNDEDDRLPYRGQFSIDWDGKLADETYPTDGQHDLVVVVQDADGNWSDEAKVVFNKMTRDVPANLSAAAQKDGSIMLSWSYISDSKPVGYRMYRNTREEVDKSHHNFYCEGILETTFIDKFTHGSVTYWYRVSAYDSTGNESELSNVASATSIDTEPPGSVFHFFAVPSDKRIDLTWHNPVDIDYAKTEIYQLVRDPPSLNYESIKDVGFKVYEGTETIVADSSLLNGHRYFYVAYACDYADNYSQGLKTSAVPNRKPMDLVLMIQMYPGFGDPNNLADYKRMAAELLNMYAANHIEGDRVAIVFFANSPLGDNAHAGNVPIRYLHMTSDFDKAKRFLMELNDTVKIYNPEGDCKKCHLRSNPCCNGGDNCWSCHSQGTIAVGTGFSKAAKELQSLFE